jgi:NAD kinase
MNLILLGSDHHVAMASSTSSEEKEAVEAHPEFGVTELRKAQLQLIKCQWDGCLPPESLRGGIIQAQQLSVREALVRWKERPRSVLIIKKWKDAEVRRATVQIALYISQECGVTVFLDAEADEWDSIRQLIRRLSRRAKAAGRAHEEAAGTHEDAPSRKVDPLTGTRGLYAFRPCAGVRDVDLIICVGGDGTVLHTSSLFQGPMPPLVSVSHGSLGFMTVFDRRRLKHLLDAIFNGVEEEEATDESEMQDSEDERLDREGSGRARGVRPLGMEQAGPIVPPTSPSALPEASKEMPLPPVGVPANPSDEGLPPWALAPGRVPAALPVTMRMRLRCDVYRRGTRTPEFSRVVLNEVSLERGPYSYLSAVDTYVDGEPLTTVQADGIIVGTPTGSTAYSLAAGGAIALPTVPAILFTPICPHSLSFRPVMFPDSARIKLVIPDDARGGVRLSFDGRTQVDDGKRDCLLNKGDFLIVRMSKYPLPLVTRKGTVGDWVRSITDKLHWNVRERQKSLEPEAHEIHMRRHPSMLVPHQPLLGSDDDDTSWDGQGYDSDSDVAGDEASKAPEPPRHAGWVHAAAETAAREGAPLTSVTESLRASITVPSEQIPAEDTVVTPSSGLRRLRTASEEGLYNRTRPRRHDSTNGYVE